ncbi:MAG: OmpA family protein [Gammaproteobacteria bacterium]|nr:OmpA family protein [Gammaproteobacteria bacterium]
MSKLILSGVMLLCLFNIVAHADTQKINDGTFKHKAETGLGIGAILGGLIAGPPGAILGMAGGAWLGGNNEKKDEKISHLNTDLVDKQTELTIMENRVSMMQEEVGREMQKVAARNRISSLKDLSKGVSLSIYFRTESSDIDMDSEPRIRKLAEFVKQFPEIKLLIEGYADKRGASIFNRQLGTKRAQAVRAALVKSGLDSKRILIHSYGESEANASESDLEGIFFDRRVNITLTLDTQI